MWRVTSSANAVSDWRSTYSRSNSWSSMRSFIKFEEPLFNPSPRDHTVFELDAVGRVDSPLVVGGHHKNDTAVVLVRFAVTPLPRFAAIIQRGLLHGLAQQGRHEIQRLARQDLGKRGRAYILARYSGAIV